MQIVYILIQGFIVGAGPCLLVCAPILLPYIAGTKRTWQEGFKATLIFGLTRSAVYTVLGGVVGYLGYFLFQLFHSQLWGRSLWGFAGLFIIVLGLLIALGKGVKNPLCRLVQKHTLENSAKSMVILGIIVGFSPCLPLIAVLTEIMFISEHFYQGFLYGAAFGIGTVISPLLLLGALTPLIPTQLMRTDKSTRIFNFICGILLVFVGVYIMGICAPQNLHF